MIWIRYSLLSNKSKMSEKCPQIPDGSECSRRISSPASNSARGSVKMNGRKYVLFRSEQGASERK